MRAAASAIAEQRPMRRCSAAVRWSFGVEVFDLAGVLAAERRRVERLDGGDAALARGERAKERVAPEPDRADDADAR